MFCVKQHKTPIYTQNNLLKKIDFSKYEVFTQTKREHNSTVIYLLH